MENREDAKTKVTQGLSAGELAKGVDDVIASHLSGPKQQSFFLYAGAGSGKTWSLVAAVRGLQAARGAWMLQLGQRVAVITYTKAATEEVRSRLGSAPLAHVSTIHSFAWGLIRGFDNDIREWMTAHLETEIEKAETLERKGVTTSQASVDRRRKIARYTAMLVNLPTVTRFSYSPDEVRPGRGGLSHAQVLKIAADFLAEKPAFRAIVVGRYPVILVDEAQDTNKELMNALLDLATSYKSRFVLGLFGDAMQRIYLDGKADLVEAVSDWDKPHKNVNRRSSRRVVSLVNKLRSPVDNFTQIAMSGAAEGHVRLFLALSMRSLTRDADWASPDLVKTLILEHAMAAERLGFASFFACFDKSADLRTIITNRDASKSETISFLGKQLLPLLRAVQTGDGYAVDELLRAYLPVGTQDQADDVRAAGAHRVAQAKLLVSRLRDLLGDESITLGAVVEVVAGIDFLPIPHDLDDAMMASRRAGIGMEQDADEGDDVNDVLQAWTAALNIDVEEFEKYYLYSTGGSAADTHQGVKGLEFDRVLVVLDDTSAKGNWFSYEKFFGVKPQSPTDLKRVASGEETMTDKTRRLLYVACSRARESLAVVVYTADADRAKSAALESRLFSEDEIVVVTSTKKDA
jgi:DNA helicase-2/ATP-dependent DNA helicase PcrA